MRIIFDRATCTGHGRCYALAPEVFDADDDGYCVPRYDEVPDDLVEKARAGVQNCPEEALALEA